MPLYELNSDNLSRIVETTFEAEGIKERGDLQRLLRSQIEVISPGTMVIAEEFGDWEESRRRIDLLCLDRNANLVVVELKRTEDGGHMELQAIRYAAMVSNMTFEKVVEIHEKFLRTLKDDSNSEVEILDFLGWDEPKKNEFAKEVSIVLASAEFSTELTGSVMWLNESGLEIRCVRLKPYKMDNRLVIDVQQIIPLPEAADYQVQMREKNRETKKERSEQQELRYKFWEMLINRSTERTNLLDNSLPITSSWLTINTDKKGLSYYLTIRKHDSEVTFNLGLKNPNENNKLFDILFETKQEIENAIGKTISWKPPQNKSSGLISIVIDIGGYRNEEIWLKIQDQMVDALDRMVKVISPYIDGIKI